MEKLAAKKMARVVLPFVVREATHLQKTLLSTKNSLGGLVLVWCHPAEKERIMSNELLVFVVLDVEAGLGQEALAGLKQNLAE